MPAVQPEPWLRALITTTNNNKADGNSFATSYDIGLLAGFIAEIQLISVSKLTSRLLSFAEAL
jgi:hypothetical protein